MTSRVLVFHPSVEDDLVAVYDYYEAFDPALSGRFEARLDEQVERIELFPESGAILFVQPGLGRRCRDVRTDSQRSARSSAETDAVQRCSTTSRLRLCRSESLFNDSRRNQQTAASPRQRSVSTCKLARLCRSGAF